MTTNILTLNQSEALKVLDAAMQLLLERARSFAALEADSNAHRLDSSLNKTRGASQLCELNGFQLGNPLVVSSQLILVCEGRVRIVRNDSIAHRSAGDLGQSVQVLGQGDVFRLPATSEVASGLYEAIAASDCWVAIFDDSQYELLLSQYPPLQHYIHHVLQENERLMLEAASLSRGSLLQPRSVHQDEALHKAPINSSESSLTFPEPKQRSWTAWSRRLPFIEQQSASDCGAACLVMIARYWGQKYGLNELRRMARVGRSGTSLKAISATADELGFQSRPIRASLGRLTDHHHPWIAHWQGDHYVVVTRVGQRYVWITDPAEGRQKLKRLIFAERWTGFGILIEPTSRLGSYTSTTSQTSLWHLSSIFRSYRGILVQILLLSLLMQLLGLITPLFTQVILDRIITEGSLPTLHIFALGLLLFSVWRVLLQGVRQYLLDHTANRIDLTLVGGFVRHALSLPLRFFEDRHVGDIITRVQENQKLQEFLVRQAISTWLDASLAVVYLGLMFYYNAKLTLAVVAMILPIALLVLGATPLLRRVSRQSFNEEANQNSSLVELLTGVDTVKAIAAESELRWRWENTFTRQLLAEFRGQKLNNFLSITSGLISALGTVLLLWLGASLVIRNQLTVGQLVAFNMLLGSVIEPLLDAVGFWDELQEVIISVERLNDVFIEKPEDDPSNPLMPLPSLQGTVHLENVCFRYDPLDDVNTLQNLSVEIQAGQTVAIVGRSGSGKTTLVKLLQGLYHPSRGRISVDDHDLKHVSPASLRAQLGVVPQESFLFSGTILENIQLYRTDYLLEDVIQAAKLAEAHAFIQNLPLGYGTKVGERGANLSGGQRQRVAIARALLGNPRILILDEATSALDTESERRFQQNLGRISQHRTTFIIAHRLSTVRNADLILVLDRGVLVEQGTHHELLKQRGLYFHLAEQQLQL